MDKSSCGFYINATMSDLAEYAFSKVSDETLAQICDLFMRQESFKRFLTFDNERIHIYPHFKNARDYIDYQIHRYCKKKDLDINPSLVSLLMPVILTHKNHKHIIKKF